ncbi:amidase signature domain-containing protein [Microdochium bolleyi]|uniref:Amidase signature domain-containing protein n=1 Tax=Microdochium bolleyi TaxID=196109 RepID=A0A136IRL0_9PEZI|nr:amidase signature domain-containing protein [Microdochium bolleyi]
MSPPSSPQKKRFFLYPEPISAPPSPPRPERKSNPAFTGLVLVIATFLLEWSGLLRQYIWQNAGFGDLRKIRHLIESAEPRFDPTVFPLGEEARPDSSSEASDTTANGNGAAQSKTAAAKPGLAPLGQRHYTVADYRELYLSGEVTPLDVAHAILPFIRRDTSPPGLHSLGWHEVNVDLILAAARASTERYASGQSLGPLDGVPSVIKDEYDMTGYTTTLGSPNDYTGKKLEDGKIDAWNVRQMEAAGIVILGKVSMHEFGMDTSGNNILFGTTRNPYNANYYTGGSSGGSAYAVATGLVPIALGSDGGGSIRIPASYCSVFGLKTSHGRLSCKPGENHSNTCGVNGPLAADIRSLAAFYGVLSEAHPTTNYPLRSPFTPSPTADQILFHPSGSHSRKKLIGIPEAWFARADPSVQRLCRATIDRLVMHRGYTTVPIEIPFLHEGQIAHALTILTDAATLLPPSHPTERRYKDEFERLSPANRILLALGRTTPAADFLLAQKLRRVLMQHLAWLWSAAQHGPDMVIVTPVSACAGWPIANTDPSGGELKRGLSDGDRTLRTMEFVWMGNFCGVPALSVPSGYVKPGENKEGVAGDVAAAGDAGKVPVGLMAMGEWASEEALLRFGLDAEELMGPEDEGVQCRPECWVDVLRLAKERKGRA